MSYFRHAILGLLFLLAGSASLACAEEKARDARVLDARAKQVRRLEVGSALGGYRNTLVFYTFEDQKAVLKVVIDNKSKKFPVSATVYAFAENVTADGLKKWLNNQHSDGLYPDVPNPASTHKVPAGSCKALSHKLINHTRESFGEYDNYSVAFQVSGVPKLGRLQVKDFTDKGTVHLKTN